MRGLTVGVLVVIALIMLSAACGIGLRLIPQTGANAPAPMYRRCTACQQGTSSVESDSPFWTCLKCGKMHGIDEGIDPVFSPDG
jgi:hypothetical protein